jgi:hypothetical protein
MHAYIFALSLLLAFSVTMATGLRIPIPDFSPSPANTFTDDCGSFSYPPNGGNYHDNESVVWLVQPESGGPREISLTRLDTEQFYDTVSIFVWEDNQFVIANKLGPTLPNFISLKKLIDFFY